MARLAAIQILKSFVPNDTEAFGIPESFGTKVMTLVFGYPPTTILYNYVIKMLSSLLIFLLLSAALSTEELIAQCVIFFLAGFETSASTLAFVSYCLALNPDVQEKLTREIDNARQESNVSDLLR